MFKLLIIYFDKRECLWCVLQNVVSKIPEKVFQYMQEHCQFLVLYRNVKHEGSGQKVDLTL
jgi:pantothenate kinase